jgi:signal transduction histidine kinase
MDSIPSLPKRAANRRTRREKFDFNELVQETVDFLASLVVARKVEFSSSLTPIALPIVGDRIQLQQVILNVLINAAYAMANTPSDSRTTGVQTPRVDDFAELSLSDNGPGIPEDTLKKVFKPFFTYNAEGMGMELSIARTIMEAHDGRIWAENQPHGGALFIIRLPLDGIH